MLTHTFTHGDTNTIYYPDVTVAPGTLSFLFLRFSIQVYGLSKKNDIVGCDSLNYEMYICFD